MLNLMLFYKPLNNSCYIVSVIDKLLLPFIPFTILCRQFLGNNNYSRYKTSESKIKAKKDKLVRGYKYGA